MMKSAKQTVYDQFKNTDFNDEELVSALTGAKVLIKSRTLTYQQADARVVSPNTPSHFLFDQLAGQFAPEVEEQIYYGVKRRLRHVQLLVQHIWKRWMLELIPTLD